MNVKMLLILTLSLMSVTIYAQDFIEIKKDNTIIYSAKNIKSSTLKKVDSLAKLELIKEFSDAKFYCVKFSKNISNKEEVIRGYIKRENAEIVVKAYQVQGAGKKPKRRKRGPGSVNGSKSKN